LADIVDAKTRSRMMAGIRGKNTKPEVTLRKALHSMGYRFRLHHKDLPGRPDIVLPRYRAVILVDGCFWHGHTCKAFRLPNTRREFWETKINQNKIRDENVKQQLTVMGWRIARVWECTLRGKNTSEITAVSRVIGKWLEGSKPELELGG